jgi:hypothetical protein
MTRLALIAFLVVCTIAGSFAAGPANKAKGRVESPMIESKRVQEIPSKPMPGVQGMPLGTNSATPTTLTGWYDYQSNGGAVEQIRVNPANGNINTTWMTAFDSTEANHNNSRRTAYAYSTDGGATWNNFNSMYVPDRRSGFPTIDIGQGPIAGSPIITNHSIINSAAGNQATIFIDSPEGGGAFGEIAPPTGFGSDEAIWPYAAGASDGSVVMAASRSTAATVHYARTGDFVTWSTLTQMTGPTQSGGRYPVQANGTGRVGILANTSNGTAALGNWWIESTNNGQTWTTPVNMFSQRADAGDTLYPYVHCDFVYNGNNPLFVFTEYSALATSTREDIVFWSQATGYKVAVPYDSVNYGPYNNPSNTQRFFNLLANYPSIGMSGNTIVVVYCAFQPDTDRLGWNYTDLWYVTSANGGNTWSVPTRLTNTPHVDERYPSVSKWNAPGEFNVVWTQKTGASGLYAFPGASQAPGADTVRTYQMYQKIALSGVSQERGIAQGFRLAQNYPNPFNPSTKIDYDIAAAGPVTITEYNVLGEEIATLLHENLNPGHYQLVVDGSRLSSGVYFYKMTAHGFSQTRKMILMK